SQAAGACESAGAEAYIGGMRSFTRCFALGSLALFACGGSPEPRAPLHPRESVESAWDLAPREAAAGVVVQAGGLARLLGLVESLDDGPARRQLADAAAKADLAALGTPAGLRRAGLDPALEAAAFAWPDKDRGLLLVLPVSDRARFREALHLATRTEGGAEL